jgi:hypothetical protein
MGDLRGATLVDPETPVLQRMLDDWGHIMAAFPKHVTSEVRDDVLARMKGIQTFRDFERTGNNCGPYTPFEFSDVRPSITTAEKLLEETWEFFFEH